MWKLIMRVKHSVIGCKIVNSEKEEILIPRQTDLQIQKSIRLQHLWFLVYNLPTVVFVQEFLYAVLNTT